MRKITALVFLTVIGILQSAQASSLTCTESVPCTLTEALTPGNYIEVQQLVYNSPAGPIYETMKFSNFDASVGNFGGEAISVWGAAVGLDWKLVFQPSSSAANPWRIQSSGPDASYSSTLTYDVQFDGRRLNVYGRTPRSHLADAGLGVTYGEFRNVGGLSIGGSVRETITDDRVPSSSGPPVDLAVTCSDLETSVFLGCARKTGADSGWFDSYSGFDGFDQLTIENSIQLDYIAFTGGGGAVEVVRIVNQFSEAAIVSEPGSLTVVVLGLVAIVLQRARAKREPARVPAIT